MKNLDPSFFYFQELVTTHRGSIRNSLYPPQSAFSIAQQWNSGMIIYLYIKSRQELYFLQKLRIYKGTVGGG
jgi:hypothetical protein